MASANEAILDFLTAHLIDLQRFSADRRVQVRSFLRDLEAELVGKLASSDPSAPARERYRKARLKKLLDLVQETIRTSYRAQTTQVLSELIDFADLEAEFIVRAINNGLTFKAATVEFTPASLKALVSDTLVQGTVISDWGSRQAGDLLQRFGDQVRMGVAQGESNPALINRVKTNVFPVHVNLAEKLVRSSTMAVAEKARREVYKQNLDILKGVMWTATLDTRTSIECAARDGKLYDPVTLEPIGHDLPWGGGPGNLHWGCRSVSTPVTKSFRDLGIDVDDLPRESRASIDGQVPDDTTFENWIQRQSKARQDKILGAGRADLWRRGQLSLRDLLDGNARPLSLSELRQKLDEN